MICSDAMRLVNQYVEDVLSGEICVCENTRLAVQRHVDDMEKQRTEEFPYYFDAEKASAAIDFFPACLKHSIGDHQGMPFLLEGWQSFGVAMLFGWVRVVDECRRFRRTLWTMARKQGKSTLASGLSLQLAGLDWNPIRQQIENVADVLLCATKIEQSREVIFREVLRMREQSEEITDATEFKYSRVIFPNNEGSIRCVGSDRPFSGLNPLVVFVDEYHEFKETHRPFIDTMLTASGARSQPLFIVTTTAGDSKSLLYYEFYDYVVSVLRGTVQDEEVFGLIFELDPDDDPLDESNWIKANPNLGISIKVDFLRQMAREARTSSIAMNRFVRYHGNRLVSSTEQAFDMDAWGSCAGDLSNWHKADAIGAGVDLGGRDDLAAWALVARFDTGEVTKIETATGIKEQPVYRYEAQAWSYIAESTPRDLTREPFASWCYSGNINKCSYPITQMQGDLVDACQDLGVNDVAYDPAGGQILAEQVEQEGIQIASMAQTYAYFHEPITDMMQAIRDGRFMHSGDPVLSWAVSNAVAVQDRQGRWMFDKSKSSEKIDPAVAMTMAYRRAMVAPPKSKGSLCII